MVGHTSGVQETAQPRRFGWVVNITGVLFCRLAALARRGRHGRVGVSDGADEVDRFRQRRVEGADFRRRRIDADRQR